MLQIFLFYGNTCIGEVNVQVTGIYSNIYSTGVFRRIFAGVIDKVIKCYTQQIFISLYSQLLFLNSVVNMKCYFVFWIFFYCSRI